MTRKDYEALAAGLRTARDWAQTDGERQAVNFTTAAIANVLEADNPRFDRERFLTAARGES